MPVDFTTPCIISLTGILAIALSFWGLCHLFARVRRLRRIERGLCPKCAYDLRGSADAAACPECGATK